MNPNGDTKHNAKTDFGSCLGVMFIKTIHAAAKLYWEQ